jgi:hypothetical protein
MSLPQHKRDLPLSEPRFSSLNRLSGPGYSTTLADILGTAAKAEREGARAASTGSAARRSSSSTRFGHINSGN